MIDDQEFPLDQDDTPSVPELTPAQRVNSELYSYIMQLMGKDTYRGANVGPHATTPIALRDGQIKDLTPFSIPRGFYAPSEDPSIIDYALGIYYETPNDLPLPRNVVIVTPPKGTEIEEGEPAFFRDPGGKQTVLKVYWTPQGAQYFGVDGVSYSWDEIIDVEEGKAVDRDGSLLAMNPVRATIRDNLVATLKAQLEAASSGDAEATAYLRQVRVVSAIPNKEGGYTMPKPENELFNRVSADRTSWLIGLLGRMHAIQPAKFPEPQTPFLRNAFGIPNIPPGIVPPSTP